MTKQTTIQFIEDTLSKLGAFQSDEPELALYDYPSNKANPHFHFAFDAYNLQEATQVTVMLMGRGDNFKIEGGKPVDVHLTPLGVFSLEGFATFLECLLSATSNNKRP
ncbi:hypothetical protein P1X15_09965 [Runella sp. MFBS21]|uniref:hypothetical protein n=1 Tax=Runella sp. MFBS21 TaxID=3034018 RepID=UPI0023F8423D|nr:hypothetical protein [Runella sp. MFBS21]MDF7817923.1 hypothetical protein [Runella sp. MFBS21]